MALGEGIVHLITEDLYPVEIQLEQLAPRAVADLFNVNFNGTAWACMHDDFFFVFFYLYNL